jgi:protein involved in polysaccharide export with SLBB domain
MRYLAIVVSFIAITLSIGVSHSADEKYGIGADATGLMDTINADDNNYGDFQDNDRLSSGSRDMGEISGQRMNRNNKDLQDIKRAIEKRGSDVIEKGEEQETQKKPKLLLKSEPGDSSVALSWRLIDYKDKPEIGPLKYSIVYGTESGKVQKKIDVGTLSSYKLRELKNRQMYFVKVLAFTKDKKLFVSSEEEQVLPLAEEEMGSSLERAFSKKSLTLQDKVETAPLKREIRQFGYNFFKNTLATSSANENIPVGSDYVIGTGDSIRINIWGSLQARYELTVDRNGEITIPRVGVIKVWGLKYDQLKEVINKAISRYFKGYELNVTLGNIRTIQVFVVGEVESPGVYSISALGTVVNALAAAGGPSKNGSLRTIKLMKNGVLHQSVDLYDIFLSGDRSKDIRLENGDTIFVPVIGPVVAVVGEVKRPGIYELKDKTSLAQVLTMAGGITAAGDTGRLQVERIEGNSARIVLDYEAKGKELGKDKNQIEILDRDMVKVFPILDAVRQVVTLKGNVVRPGEYQYRKGMRVTDLITGYSSMLPDSYLEAAEIVRLVAPDYHREIISFNLKKALDNDPKENIELQEQDTIKVFSRWDLQEKPVVSINGQVVNPGSFDYYPNMTVRDLVNAAGSLKRNAFLDGAELTRVVVEYGKAKAIRIHVDIGKALLGDNQANLQLQPDDVLIVRGIVDWLDATDRFVTLKGEVKFPGVYSISKGEKLSSVIARAGGYTEKAYLRGAKFTRKAVKESQQKRMDEVITRTEKDILQKQSAMASVAASKEELEGTKSALEGLLRNLERLKGVKAEGRVVIRLEHIEELKKSSYDLELMGGDTLEIPQTPNVVNVMGEVYNATTFVYLPETNLSEYLKKAGGPTREAEEGEMYLIRADGSVASRQQSSFGIHWDEDSRSWTFGGFMSMHMEPGDTVVVPQRLERTAWLRDIKDLTTILSQIALTAGTVLLGLK